MNASPTLKRIVGARTTMLFSQPFWGQLSMRLTLVEDPTCETAWTDGQSLGYNPTFIASLDHAKLVGLLAHETEHCTRGHPWRRGGRDKNRFNEAADRAINPDLREAHFSLPDGVLYELEPSHIGKSAEWIYDRLPPPTGGEGGKGKGGAGEDGQGGQKPSSSAFGEVRDAPAPAAGDEQADGAEGDAEPVPTEEDWRQVVQQAAAAARSRGMLPAGLEDLIAKTTKSRIDWKSATQRFAQEIARNDYSWQRPSARYLPQGLYLPSLRSEEVGVLLIGLDTSGSIDQVLLQQFAGQMQAVQDEVKPRKIVVLHCDTKVHLVEEFEQGDPITLHAIGRGGTDFRPVFEYVEQMDEPPVAIIYLTDLAGRFPDQDPGIPTLWVTGQDTREVVPFGELVSAV